MTSFTGIAGTTTLEATGTGSTLTLANLSSVTEGSNAYQAQTQFEALAGGTVALPALDDQHGHGGPGERWQRQRVECVAALTTSRTPMAGRTRHFKHPTATIDDGSLATLSEVNMTIAGPGENLTQGSVTSFNSGSITGQRGCVPEFAGSDQLHRAFRHHYVGGDRHRKHADVGPPHERDATNEQLPGPDQLRGIGRRHGDADCVQTINTGTVVLEADGSGSVLNVPALTTFTEANGWTFSTLQVSNNGTVNDAALATLSNMNMTIAGPGENLTQGSVTSFNSGNITVSGDASLSLPGVTSYTGLSGTTTLEATGTGSTLTLAHLTSVTQPTNNYQAQTNFEALAGGTVTLTALYDDRHWHRGVGGRRQRQRLECAGTHDVHGSQRLDLLNVASFQ